MENERESIMPKPIQLDLPYPSFDCICEDLRSAMIISPAYASSHSELNAILQYIYHFFNFSRLGQDKTAETLMGIAVAEMHHLEILGLTIDKLGVNPLFAEYPQSRWNFYSSVSVGYSRLPEKMLMDDISGELAAINEYKRMLTELKNEKVAAIISRIVLDEELHVKVLKERLEALKNGCYSVDF